MSDRILLVCNVIRSFICGTQFVFTSRHLPGCPLRGFRHV